MEYVKTYIVYIVITLDKVKNYASSTSEAVRFVAHYYINKILFTEEKNGLKILIEMLLLPVIKPMLVFYCTAYMLKI